MLNGIIVVYKDSGMSSHDVVYKVRKLTGQKKTGHMGTLDPQAQGVLPVCMGSATRLSDLFLNADKQYRAVLRLGVVTDTQDMTGEVLRRSEQIPAEEEIRRAAARFVGDISQIPPMYSAIKHQGKKLYQLARKGVEIEREPRQIHISELVVEQVNSDRVTLLVTCSKGTYIRTLCADIGEALGCGGCMESLIRTRSGRFRAEEAYTLAELELVASKGRLAELVMTPDVFFSVLPAWATVPEDDYLLHNGNPLDIRDMVRCERDPVRRDAGIPAADVAGSAGSTMIEVDNGIAGTVDSDADNGSDSVYLPDDLSPLNAIRLYDSTGAFWGVYRKAGRFHKPWKMFPCTD